MDAWDPVAYRQARETGTPPPSLRLTTLELTRWPVESLPEVTHLLYYLTRGVVYELRLATGRRSEPRSAYCGKAPVRLPVLYLPPPAPLPPLTAEEQESVDALRAYPRLPPLFFEDQRQQERVMRHVPYHRCWGLQVRTRDCTYQQLWYRVGDLDELERLPEPDRRTLPPPTLGAMSWARYATIVQLRGGDPLADVPDSWSSLDLDALPEDTREALQYQCRWTLPLELVSAHLRTHTHTMLTLLQWGRLHLVSPTRLTYLDPELGHQLEEAGIPLPEGDIVCDPEVFLQAAREERYTREELVGAATSMIGDRCLAEWWLDREGEPELWPEDAGGGKTPIAHLFLYGEWRMEQGYYVWWTPLAREIAEEWVPGPGATRPETAAMVFITQSCITQVRVADWKVRLIWLPIRESWPSESRARSARSATC